MSRERTDDTPNPFGRGDGAVAHAPGRRGPRTEFDRRAHRFSDARRSFRDAGDFAIASARVPGHARGDGICGQRDNYRHGGIEPRRRRPQSADRPEAWRRCLPCGPRHPDIAARNRARSHDLHWPPRRAGPLHGRSFHADPRLSRRAFHRGGSSCGLCCLYHRKRGLEFHRQAHVRRACRPFRDRREFCRIRRPEPERGARGVSDA